MGSYQGAGTSHEVRLELAQRAIAIGYTRDGAGRLMDEAYWVEGAGYGDECVKHPGCRTSPVDGCEACEVVRQSDAKGFMAGQPKASKPVKVKVVHYVESAEVHSPCGHSPVGDTDPSKTTCTGCKRSRRHQKALYAHLTEKVRAVFGDAGIRTEMMVRHRASGVLGVIGTIDASGAMVGYWGPDSGFTRDDYLFATPEALLSCVEMITVDDLVTVGSQVSYMGNAYLVTKVTMATGVHMAVSDPWRDSLVMPASDFAANLSRGYVEVTKLALSGAESDPLLIMIVDAQADRRRDLMATFPIGGYLLVKDGDRRVLSRVVSHTDESITYGRIGAGERSRTVTWDQFAGFAERKVIEATTVGVDDLGDPIDITLTASGGGSRSAESVDVFQVTGAGVHNRYGSHQITAFYGVCCNVAQVHLHLSSLASVISDRPQSRPVRHTVAIGDVITVDREVYRVTARRVADPILTPVRFE